MYFSPMMRTESATCAGSPGSSQPCGLPVSTAQNLQARVHTDPMIMIVAVPALQHSAIFGHMDSSQTVERLCSRTFARTFSKPSPLGSFTLSQAGLRTNVAGGGAEARARMPFLIAENPCGVLNLRPL